MLWSGEPRSKNKLRILRVLNKKATPNGWLFYLYTMKKTESYIFGIYPVLQALETNTTIDKLYLQKDIQNSKIEEILTKAESLGISISQVPIQKLHQLTKSNHQGVVAQISPLRFVSIEEAVENSNNGIFLLLDQVSDVRNLGAIIRTAECTGVAAVILPKTGSAPINGDTVKTSAGAIFNVPICKVDHIKDAIYYMQASGIKTIAATEKSDQTIYDTSFEAPIAVVMGSEGKGVSKSVLQLVDAKVSLPLLGTINSLNVSVACGVFLYEIIRYQNH